MRNVTFFVCFQSQVQELERDYSLTIKACEESVRRARQEVNDDHQLNVGRMRNNGCFWCSGAEAEQNGPISMEEIARRYYSLCVRYFLLIRFYFQKKIQLNLISNLPQKNLISNCGSI